MNVWQVLDHPVVWNLSRVYLPGPGPQWREMHYELPHLGRWSPDGMAVDPEPRPLLEHLQLAFRDYRSSVPPIVVREVLTALVLGGVPIDVLAERLSTTRGALYKTLHDARRKLREVLGSEGDD